MSAYPSLLSPLMDATGLIATTALNTTAQSALAAGVSANEKVDILEPIALKSVANVYTGLPSTNMVIDNDIKATEFRITNAKFEENKLTLADGTQLASLYAHNTELRTNSSLNVSGMIQSNTGLSLYPIDGNAVLECYIPLNSIKSFSGATLDGFGTAEFATVKATQTSGTVFQNNDASFSVDFEGNATVKQLNYTTLFPSPSGGWVGTAASNLNMSGYEVLNTPKLQLYNPVGDLECNLTMISNHGQSAVSFESNGLDNIANIYCGRVIATANINCGSITVTDGAQSYAEIDATGAINCTTVNNVDVGFKPTYDYYVAKGGSDDGYGSILLPFLTVQRAITQCEIDYDGTPRTIHLSSGTFTENIMISKPRISIIGQGSSMNPDVGSSIAGNFNINLTAGNSDMDNNNIYFSGLLLNSFVLDQTFGIVHRLFFTDCYLYSSDSVLSVHTAITLDYRVFIDRCSISNSSTSAGNPVVSFYGAGMVSITNSKITSKGAVQVNVIITDNVRVDTFTQNILTSDSVNTNAMPILTLDTTQTISVRLCTFIYSNAAAKSNTVNNSSGVFMANSGNLYITQCFFNLLGLDAPNNAIRNIGTGKIYFGLCSAPSPTLACTIQGVLNTDKYAMVSVQ